MASVVMASIVMAYIVMAYSLLEAAHQHFRRAETPRARSVDVMLQHSRHGGIQVGCNILFIVIIRAAAHQTWRHTSLCQLPAEP